MTDSQQQFCLRWNNFQANITSQFEALRDDEDFVDVTFACDGRRLQAHKVVLSACSPYFKELFKTNPCKHPIIFMRDVEFEHLQSLLEFMYAGEVNISQAELPTFLRTAESLQIRGLTDSQSNQHNNEKFSKTNNIHTSNGRGLTSPSFDDERSKTPSPSSPPPLKRLCKRSDSPQNSSPIPPAAVAAASAAPPPTSGPRSRPVIEPQVQLDCYKDVDVVEPKIELPEYGSDDECSTKPDINTLPGGFLSLDGGMEVLPSYPTSYSGSGIEGGMPGPSHGNSELNQDQQAEIVLGDEGLIGDEAVPADSGSSSSSMLAFGSSSVTGSAAGGEIGGGTCWDSPRVCPVCPRIYSNNSNLRRHVRSAHPTATDLLEITSLQRKPTGPPVKLMTIDSQIQRPTTFTNQSTFNIDDYGDTIPHDSLNTHSNNASMKCENVQIQRSDIESYSVGYDPT
ncbi:zinc finger and BTB domain-containing protein 12-like isoform X4 [Leptopilina heterotoma]|uniref:zinc finger and BTB domain-containing protein 12-like isoform X4 n=1 Tax=Leptopilina heterotoma TaxID=63436 RepID=UPI001CA91B96|nr:zinc finger and BTB domain-containing protein 12-like isoform X4 [Leptopilina heterotoma]